MAIKRCPTCNQEFTDEWLTFCTNDGTSLVSVDRSSEEPPPTIVSMPPSVSPLEQPTMDMPGASFTPPPYSPPLPPPSGAIQPGWKVPPPPAFPKSNDVNLALVSLILGLVSITIGCFCYFGVLTAPVAIGLGVYALSLIKKDPARYGGKGLAYGGIVTGALYFVIIALFFMFYGFTLLSGL